MLNRNLVHRSIAVLLMLMVFVTMANALASVRSGHAATLPVIADAACFSVPADPGVPPGGDFKPPKHSFVDYDMFFSCVGFKPITRPVTFHITSDDGNRVLSGAWPEILVPPKI